MSTKPNGVPYPSIYLNDDFPTYTSDEQERVEASILSFYENRARRNVKLGYDIHSFFAAGGLTDLPGSIAYLDASRVWLTYWNLNSLDILGYPVSLADGKTGPRVPTPEEIVSFLESCFTEISPEMGSFGGGPHQIPHLATTYSAAYNVLSSRKNQLYNWFMSLKQPDGSFIMHHGGEVDVRASYCVLLPSVLLGLDTDELLENAAEFVARCQTYEGGFGCQPYEEAHGGYTYCATAALALIRRTDLINLPALKKWLAKRQCSVEGGFNGRTNKLVDACYSFWVGGAHAIASGLEAERRRLPDGSVKSVEDAILIDMIAYQDFESIVLNETLEQEVVGCSKNAEEEGDWQDVENEGLFAFDQDALQKYVLTCCQDPSGGLRDKPGVRSDHYHTCYTLTGWSIAQNLGKAYHVARLGGDSLLTNIPDKLHDGSMISESKKKELLGRLEDCEADPILITEPENSLLRYTNPIFPLRRDRVVKALRFFRGIPFLPRK